SGVGVCITVKILGLVMLCSAIIIFECWFRFFKKMTKDAEKAVNRVVEVQAP
ncbi:hypothetical protein XENOCAPTIV_020165, partial [Xenoophorus captivus]